ncbi:hypothetical protein ACIQJT_25905 [Streptomyces sp. NPDC091972]|uniref:hypothetical protein n=1 Tax=Streptomyces sp. NPDC091972 TaxID=3366007 RepID=UPI003804D66A
MGEGALGPPDTAVTVSLLAPIDELGALTRPARQEIHDTPPALQNPSLRRR